MVEPHEATKKIEYPLIEVREGRISIIWNEGTEQKRLSWEDLYELGIDDSMLKFAIEDYLVETYPEYYMGCEASVFHGMLEFPELSCEVLDISDDIERKLKSAGFEIVRCRHSILLDSFGEREPVSENYVPEILPPPENPNVYRGDNVEDFCCRVTGQPFMARPLIYCNPHNGSEYFFCIICEKAGRKDPWHPYIVGNKERGYDEQNMLTAIKALGDGHSVYEIAKYCGEEFKGDWDRRKVLRICDKLSKMGKVRYETETRNNRQVKLVFLDRASP